MISVVASDKKCDKRDQKGPEMCDTKFDLPSYNMDKQKIIRCLTKLLRGFQGTSCKERTRPSVQFDS